MASISERVHIRWGEDASSEPTHTLVLTSLRHQFIDIRIFKATEKDEPYLPNEGSPMSRLEWAFSGTTESNTVEPPSDLNEGYHHSVWRHVIDSKVPFDETPPVDEGDIYPQRDSNISYEYGAMVNPATNEMTDYQEVWRDLDCLSLDTDGMKSCSVLTTENTEHKIRGIIIRVGQYCQALLKVGDEINVERWHYTPRRPESPYSDPFQDDDSQDSTFVGRSGDWTRQLKLGSRFLPCVVTFQDENNSVGDKITRGDFEWTIVEKEEWD
ncbi:hypothetical protein EJ05DRAFT_497789 [Pseudovirgaria hyperparasitica]|uniref:Protein HRI1 n=1 Tax=Pseudovirgaria hyperparasitica TaxID=470096 RepID=A0A6A6WGA4_9PEZI|nr:uncharacterized protein EJ05DRAFT_497789 [Pseudovirgaria hyperparasitica]KAF2761239.1 hypothetical protein EJ05DRAFT_497789 [Pseudovirgaria hyperparasitica]